MKYVFKYIYKGSQQTSDPSWSEEEPVVFNEVKRFQDARYFLYLTQCGGSNIHPFVMSLQIYLPHNHVRFDEHDDLTMLLKRERD